MPSLDKDTLILQTRKELIETGTTSGQWDDTEIAEFLQEANERLTDISEMEDVDTAVTVAGQEHVAYPAALGKILGVWARLQGTTGAFMKLRRAAVDERFPDQANGTAGRDEPNAYFIFEDKIYLTPVPDKVYDLNLFGYRKASNFVTGGGTTVPIFDTDFHHLCRTYAVARCKQKVDDPGYTGYDAQYLAGETGLLAKLSKQRNTEGPKMVKLVTPVW